MIERIVMLRSYARAHERIKRAKDGELESDYWSDMVFEIVKGIIDRKRRRGS